MYNFFDTFHTLRSQRNQDPKIHTGQKELKAREHYSNRDAILEFVIYLTYITKVEPKVEIHCWLYSNFVMSQPKMTSLFVHTAVCIQYISFLCWYVHTVCIHICSVLVCTYSMHTVHICAGMYDICTDRKSTV